MDGFQAYQDRLWYAVFIFGRYFLLRGRKEVTFLLWDQVRFLTTAEDDKQVELVKVIQNFYNGGPINLNNTTAWCVKEITPHVYPNENDPFCPIKFLKFFKSLCPPEQTQVFCKPFNKVQRKQYIQENLPYKYNQNLVLGEHTIITATKEFVERMGFKEW